MLSSDIARGDPRPGRERRGKPRRGGGFLVGLLLLTPLIAHGGDDGATVEALLARAERALVANRLTTPATDNAVDYLERVLAVNPGHPRAVALLEQVVVRYQGLVDQVLDQGEQARLQGLERALTFRDRAHRVIAQHRLSSNAVDEMDTRIAALGKPATVSGEPEAMASTDAMLRALVQQHVILAGMFLKEADFAEADWHAGQVQAVADRYRLVAKGLPEVRQQLARTQASQQRPAVAASGPAVTGETRERLTELAAFHVVSETVALAQGDAAAALNHRRTAAELVAQYGLSEEAIQSRSAQIGQPRAAIRTAGRRVFGTF